MIIVILLIFDDNLVLWKHRNLVKAGREIREGKSVKGEKKSNSSNNTHESYSVLEAVNFFHGKVGQPFIGDYVHNISRQPGNPRNARHAVVPDIHATNYPTGTGRQVVNASGATRSADAIFEVKTFNFCPTRYNHNNQNINPANQRAQEIVNQYRCKVRNLDVMMLADRIIVTAGGDNWI